jgi:Bacterial PH domain
MAIQGSGAGLVSGGSWYAWSRRLRRSGPDLGTSSARVYRRLPRQIFVAVLLTSMGAISLGIMSSAVFAPDTTGSDRAILGFFLFVSILCLFMGVRSPFLRIEAGADAVQVVSWGGSRVVPWTHVARIDEPPANGYWRAGIRFVLVDGSVVADEAFGRAPVESSKDTDRALRELKEYRRAAWIRAGLLDEDPS